MLNYLRLEELIDSIVSNSIAVKQWMYQLDRKGKDLTDIMKKIERIADELDSLETWLGETFIGA